MRVNQIQNLCWGLNVLVLVGMSWVGYGFVGTARARGERETFEFPKASKTAPLSRSWPGEITRFDHIWKTPVDGLVPKPPEVIKTEPAKRDAKEELRKAVTYDGSWHYVDAESRSMVFLTLNPGGSKTIRVGENLLVGSDNWQLTGVAFNPDTKKNVLTFHSPGFGWVDIEATRPGEPFPKSTDPSTGWTRVLDPEVIDPAEVPAGQISRRAIPDRQDPNRWTIPREERLWWQVHGREQVWEKVPTVEHVDQAGVSHGLKFNATPGEGVQALGSQHRGILKGDVLKSINGTPVRSKADVISYLRGDGAGAATYEVVIEREGKDIVLRYDVERRRSDP